MTERDAKIRRLLETLIASETDRALLGDILSDAGFRMLREVEKTPFPADPERISAARKGIVIDVETTGVDVEKDGVTQLAMLEIFYDDAGIVDIGRIFDRLRDPGLPIPAEVTRITGITDEMVAGQVIDEADIRDFTSGASLFIAHNAGFDRKMAERCFPGAGFQGSDWHCSLSQVNWLARGANGRSLELLALGQGFVYGSHNAANDIRATAFVLNTPDDSGKSAFVEMLEEGAKNKLAVIAEGSPFDRKDILKENGFRWSPDGLDSFGHKSVWHTVVDDNVTALGELGRLLSQRVYGRDKSLPAYRITARERYSLRKPETRDLFRTNDASDALSLLSQAHEEPLNLRSGPLL